MGQGASASNGGVGLFDQLTVIDVDEIDMAMPENNLRTLLIQCPCCSMFKLPDLPVGFLHDQLMKEFPLLFKEICEKCAIVSNQKEAIDYLNDQIHSLSSTVERLRAIRSIEEEIEQSINCMTPARFSQQNYCDAKQSMSDMSANDLNDIDLNKENDTQDMDHEIDNMSRQFSHLNVGTVGASLVTSTEQVNNSSVAPDTLPIDETSSLEALEVSLSKESVCTTSSFATTVSDEGINDTSITSTCNTSLENFHTIRKEADEKSSHYGILTINAQDIPEGERSFINDANIYVTNTLKQPILSKVSTIKSVIVTSLRKKEKLIT